MTDSKNLNPNYLRLGVNIDHVATLRNARGAHYPDPVAAAMAAIAAGADGITVHLREDRRHIRDADTAALKSAITKPLNLEIAATDEMLSIALKLKPNAVCIVPEKRIEITTEGGLDAVGQQHRLTEITTILKVNGIRVSLFIEPDLAQIEASKNIGVDIVELHTGRYSNNADMGGSELMKIQQGAKIADELGLECHAGHGLNFDNVGAIAAIPELHELNIGHFLIGVAITMGLNPAVKKMRAEMDKARI